MLSPLLRTVGQALVAEPLTVPSTQLEPDTREESRTAAKARLTEELATLPQHTAYCKLLQEKESKQYLIRTMPPPSYLRDAAGTPLTAGELERIAWIREHSRQTYGTAVADVQRHIRERLSPSEPSVSIKTPVVVPKTSRPRTKRVGKLTE